MTNRKDFESCIAFARAHHERFMADFKELLRFPSIATNPDYRADVVHAGEWVVAKMKSAGLNNVQLIPTQGQPAAYGEWLGAGKEAPTILFYAHYDVQPVDPLNLWDSPPFEPTERDGKLHARGVIDDKCGVVVHIQAFESILKSTGHLPINAKFIFEGEEESGSPSMGQFIRDHKEMLRADLVVSSDGGMDNHQPQAFTSLRGIVTGEVLVKGPIKDLHSGMYGGVVHNATHMVARMIAGAQDAEGHIRIPGFYDDVKRLSAAELEALKGQEKEALTRAVRDVGTKPFWGVPDYAFIERQTAQPTFDVNGIFGGYAGKGNKTIIPAEAGFKASMRLVHDQDPEDIARKFVDYINSFACDTLDIDVKITSKSWPTKALFDGPAMEALHKAFEATWGKRVSLYRQGGSIPIMGMFQRELGVPITNLGFGDGENVHAPNEFFWLDSYYRGIETAIHYYHYLAEGL